MMMINLYEISLDSACALDTAMVQTYEDASKYLTIREEMNRFLLNLTYSQQTALSSQQIHYLFVSLEHLRNVEKEIHISGVDDEIIRLKQVLDKILSLKQLILEYIRYLSPEE